ncbi:hypothetical protein IW262DRAFT_1301111 [Armillaria fumosa]|nr:hypothetical protein IW262DRAFT_1301111 [Armillaria fumosa]
MSFSGLGPSPRLSLEYGCRFILVLYSSWHSGILVRGYVSTSGIPMKWGVYKDLCGIGPASALNISNAFLDNDKQGVHAGTPPRSSITTLSSPLLYPSPCLFSHSWRSLEQTIHYGVAEFWLEGTVRLCRGHQFVCHQVSISGEQGDGNTLGSVEHEDAQMAGASLPCHCLAREQWLLDDGDLQSAMMDELGKCTVKVIELMLFEEDSGLGDHVGCLTRSAIVDLREQTFEIFKDVTCSELLFLHLADMLLGHMSHSEQGRGEDNESSDFHDVHKWEDNAMGKATRLDEQTLKNIPMRAFGLENSWLARLVDGTELENASRRERSDDFLHVIAMAWFRQVFLRRKAGAVSTFTQGEINQQA